MVSLFDTEKLYNLLKNFYEITKIRITVFDETGQELLSYPEDLPPFCMTVRSTETGRLACARCDREACRRAAAERTTQIYLCHAGLTEAVAPIIVQNVLAGYLLFGHVFSDTGRDRGWKRISKCTKDLPIDQALLQKAISQQPLVPESYVTSATQIMSAVASYLVLERMAVLQSDQLAVQLDAFLTAHFTENFTAEDLCSHFSIGKTRLYQLSRQLYGHGIAQQVRSLRITKAKELLREKKRPLKEVAELCGYEDYNYFISVFTREVGVPPRRWGEGGK